MTEQEQNAKANERGVMAIIGSLSGYRFASRLNNYDFRTDFSDFGRNRRRFGYLAVRVGFEPTEPVKAQRFSRPPDSTTLAPHLLPIYPVSQTLAKPVTTLSLLPCAEAQCRLICEAVGDVNLLPVTAESAFRRSAASCIITPTMAAGDTAKAGEISRFN